MGVGEEHQTLAVAAQGRQELRHSGQPAHLVHRGALERRDIQLELPAPVLHAVPVQRARALAQARRELRARLLEGDAAGVRPRRCGMVCAPEMGIKRQIQQRAVKIQQHRVDGGPVGQVSSVIALRSISPMASVQRVR